MDRVKISSTEFELFSKYIADVSGIHLDAAKGYLLETRLSNMLRENSLRSFSHLYNLIRKDISKKLEQQMIDAITTNETSFFRDINPFELLQHKIMPDLIDHKIPESDIKNNSLSLKIWSAGCSTGQEVYSIGIVIKELLGDLAKHEISILGTDISDDALAKASHGYFNWLEIERGLPTEKLNKYFSKVNDKWKIDDEIRSLATFRKLNLMEDFNSLGNFDIIFCRNVAIYFQEDIKKILFNRIAGKLKPESVLIVGSTETISTICPFLESKRYLKSIYYKLKS